MYILKIVLIVVSIWAIPWKIYGAWLAARHENRKWFLAIIILNTLSILELYYIFFVLKKTWVDVKQDCKDGWMLFKNEFKQHKEDIL